MPHMISRRELRRRLLTPCTTPDQLHVWLKAFLGLHIPRRPMCPHHRAPFDYLVHAYFEPGRDLVVWAPRGGGKTRLAAAATLLDLLHKPGVAVRILGGSLEQSLRMWEHLVPDLDRLALDLMTGKTRTRSVRLSNASHAAVLPQSQRAVRGLRIQKLRCDELELFDPAVLEAARLTTRSLPRHDQPAIAGTIESLSTMHSPWGLMHSTVERAAAIGTPVVKWCVLDVLETCLPERDCASCPLWDDCRGLAKHADGFFRIDDAIRLKQRSSPQSWEAEMLCRRPSVKGSVFPTFDPGVHVQEDRRVSITTGAPDRSAAPAAPITLAIDFGFANPFACLWIVDDGTTVHVIDEYIQSGRSMEDHLATIESRPWPRARHIACDPAGNSRNDQTAESNVQLLRRRGYVVKNKRSLILDGVELIRRALKTATGQTTLFIHPRCANLIRALRNYHYPTNFTSELPLKDGENDHAIDALRYFYVNRSGRGVVGSRY